MSGNREEYLSHLVEAERLHEDGLISKRWPPEDSRCSDCESLLSECECEGEDDET
jgi:hypothetical protein